MKKVLFAVVFVMVVIPALFAGVPDNNVMGPDIMLIRKVDVVAVPAGGAVADGKVMGPDIMLIRKVDVVAVPAGGAVADGKVMGPEIIITRKAPVSVGGGAVADGKVMGVQVQKATQINDRSGDKDVINLNEGF